MQLIDARDAARLKNIQALYLAAFPAAERKSFSMILKKQAEGSVDILSIEEDDGAFSAWRSSRMRVISPFSTISPFPPKVGERARAGPPSSCSKPAMQTDAFFWKSRTFPCLRTTRNSASAAARSISATACARCPSKQSCSACAWKFSPREPRSRLRNTIPCTQAYSAPSAKTASASPRPARNSPSPPLARTRRLRGDFPAKHKCGPRGFSFAVRNYAPAKGASFFRTQNRNFIRLCAQTSLYAPKLSTGNVDKNRLSTGIFLILWITFTILHILSRKKSDFPLFADKTS